MSTRDTMITFALVLICLALVGCPEQPTPEPSPGMDTMTPTPTATATASATATATQPQEDTPSPSPTPTGPVVRVCDFGSDTPAPAGIILAEGVSILSVTTAP